MSTNANPLMPPIGSRAHRVLVELARYSAPVKEEALMAAHGMDELSQTVWRQGPYKSLLTSGLIERSPHGWQLTEAGRQVIDEVEDAMVAQAHDASLPEPSMAEPRTVKPFTPLKRSIQRPIREGSLDYRDIPSLHTGSSKEPS